MRNFLITSAVLVLASCGGGAPRASGDISRACLAADRSAANSRLCSCVQAAADQTLRPADRSRVAGFFEDPERAHAMRISDTPSAEAFWDRFQNFIETAEAICR